MVLGLFEKPDPDEVAVTIENRPASGASTLATVANKLFGGSGEFRFWSDINIRLSIDSYSTVSFTAPFEAEREEFRETFRPFSYKRMEVRVGGNDLFTGTMVGVFPEADAEQRSVKVDGYALPGALNDCHEPADRVPLEFDGLSFRQIADALVEPFGFTVEYKDVPRSAFEKVKLEVDQSPQELLSKLGKQLGIVLSNTAEGNLLCWKSVEPGNPVARLTEGNSPVGSVSASFSPQSYWSQITGFAKTKHGKLGNQYTERNPFLDAVVRPNSVQLDDVEPADVPAATRARLGRMLANTATYEVGGIPGWRDPQGNLWAPNTTITLVAPSVMVYREYEFLIRAVNLTQNGDEFSSSLELVLPGAFSGKSPSSLPWD